MLLFANDKLPTVHRADVAHNLGYACERLGGTTEATFWYHRALEINPCLSITMEALARLGKADLPAAALDDALDPIASAYGTTGGSD